MTREPTRSAADTTRRRLLAGVAAAGVVGTAGCLGTRSGPVPAPTVTSDRIEDGWRLVDETEETVFEQAYGPVTVRALAATQLYEYVSVAEALAEVTDGSGSPVVFFATRIDIRPAVDTLPVGGARDRVMSRAESAAVDAFRAQLSNGGIENVEVVEEGTTTVTGDHTATTWRLEGEYPISGSVTGRDGSTSSIDASASVEAQLGVWHDGTDVLVAGGAYPSEPLASVIGDALPGPVDGETAITEIAGSDAAETLATDPATFEEEISALLVSVT
ncbi:hypothetical protein GJ633_09450 [Halorubrum sp. CBA1125]|uniref:hypothetical protein n=1 Tax=Halorubrum sp. CBA1125 TaxID=2668072 RepID=UPI0012E894D1|nr:hypothetical protein [Halorubrum sp. CBA1125]MUW14864.1 hypothetical protein [Halorubrum sp. CBA1125]